MNPVFRSASENDATVISQLGERIWHEHYPGIISLEQIDFMLRDRYSTHAIVKGMRHGEKYFLAFVGDEPVALADLEPRAGDNFLHKFYVDVSKHRTGIGNLFYDFIMKHVDYSKPTRLQVNRLNYKAINFYFKKGFIIESVGDFDIGGGYYMNDFVMVRK